MKRYTSTFEIKVGIFVFIGLVILTSLILSIGEFYLFHPGYTIKVLFGFANGIEVGAPVRVSGVEVGEIEHIQLTYDEDTTQVMVELRVWLREEAKLHADADARVNTLGLLGEKYLEIDAGTASLPLLNPGAVLRGIDPLSTEKLTEMGHETLMKVDTMIASLNEILNEETKTALRTTVKNAEVLTADLSRVSNRLDGLIDSSQHIIDRVNAGEGTIGRLIYDDSLYVGFDEFIQDIKAHPWRLLRRDVENKNDEKKGRSQGRGGIF